MASYLGNLDGIGWAGSAMEATQKKLEIAEDNISNAEVWGFHRHIAQTRMTDNGLVTETKSDPVHPPFRMTTRYLDLAIQGDGAFKMAPVTTSGVPDPKSIKSTRYGHFFRDEAGRLIDGRGNAVVASDGKFLHIHRLATANYDGTFGDPDGTLMPQSIELPQYSQLRPKHLEMSNENSISEMVYMLDASRSFETSQSVLKAEDNTRQWAIENVGAMK